jgi:hypothetical protein
MCLWRRIGWSEPSNVSTSAGFFVLLFFHQGPMEHTLFQLLLIAIFSQLPAPANAQRAVQAARLHWYATVKPWREGSIDLPLQQSASAATIPMASYSVLYKPRR